MFLQALFVGCCLMAFSEATSGGDLKPYKEEHHRHDGYRLGKHREDKHHGYGSKERYGDEDRYAGMSHRGVVYNHEDYRDERRYEGGRHHRGNRYDDSSIYNEDDDEYDGRGGRYNGGNENYNYVPGFVINPRHGNYVSDRPKMRDIYFDKCFYDGKVQYDCFPYTNYYNFKLNDRSYMEYEAAKPAQQQYGGGNARPIGYASPSPRRPKHKKNNNIYMRGGQQNIHRRPRVY